MLKRTRQEEVRRDQDRAWKVTLRSLEMAIVLGQPDAKSRAKTMQKRYEDEADRWNHMADLKQHYLLERGDERIVDAPSRAAKIKIVSVGAEAERCRKHATEAAAKAREVADILKTHENRNLKLDEVYAENPGPTPEFVAQPSRRDSITTLLMRKRLDVHHVWAAREIAEIVENLELVLHPKGAVLTAAGRPPRRSGFVLRDTTPERISDWYSHRFRPWAREMGNDLQLTWRVVIDGIALETVRHEFKPVIRQRTAVASLRKALDRYWKIKREDEKRGEE